MTEQQAWLIAFEAISTPNPDVFKTNQFECFKENTNDPVFLVRVPPQAYLDDFRYEVWSIEEIDEDSGWRDYEMERITSLNVGRGLFQFTEFGYDIIRIH
jgi:hypothetical protein